MKFIEGLTIVSVALVIVAGITKSPEAIKSVAGSLFLIWFLTGLGYFLTLDEN